MTVFIDEKFQQVPDPTIDARIADLHSRYRIEKNLTGILDERLRRRALGPDNKTGLTAIEAHARLENFLPQHVGTDFAVSDVIQMSGGGANECYSFTLRRGSESERMVLRIKARGACCETDIEREFYMLRAAESVLPVPKAYWMTLDAADFGSPALISSFIAGVSSPTDAVPLATGLGTVYGPRLQKKLAPQFVHHMARLHSHDWSAADLTGFDIPRPQTTDAIDWRLAFWDRAWEEDALEPHPTMILTQQWLWENRPTVDHISLLHGDFRNGNFLFDEEAGKITAVIDWELCYLGDRHSDLAYAMLPAWGSLDESGTFLNAGLLETETFISEYERVSGLPVDRKRLEYYLVYNLYWSVLALIGTAPRNAALRMTQLDVMYNYIYPGLGAFFNGELNRILSKD
ncbi:phosphotransferase family protein [Arthrobacter globiformis]|uniref:phosphotransferase family protein n=1 Tax=Arthrobacter globiformis TaxID=1665 RepID=UPI00278FA9FF|nr:phosphotransferase family protein [Arthrobacter globiformis]MDQ0616707.1 aminoglycoside phosphotransferase (APT) family kinase protein [Arthrobacter globiformis]